MLKNKILILSSYSPFHSCNLIKDIVDGLKFCGCEVDFVGVEDFVINEDGYYTLGKIKNYRDESIFARLKHKITSITIVNKIINYLRYSIVKKKIGEHPTFLHIDDNKPDIKMEEWESILPHKQYDLIITTFMRGHITSVTLQYLCEKYRVPLFICAVDMQPMTGGCFYFHDCNGFKNKCNYCPVMPNSRIPNVNFMLKKGVYDKYPIFACGNTYMEAYFKQSGLWNDSNYLYLPCIINEEVFIKKDRVKSRDYFSLSRDAFIIFAGAQNLFEERKGMKYLFDAISIFKESHNDVKVKLVLAGNTYGKNVSIPNVEVVMVGYLNIDEMVTMYSAADVFACPGWNDAGPSMVNQSIMCGTPVIAFNTGVAQDIVINGTTGYKAMLRDTGDFANGLDLLYKEITNNPGRFTDSCRNFGLQNFSRNEIARQILIHLNKVSIT